MKILFLKFTSLAFSIAFFALFILGCSVQPSSTSIKSQDGISAIAATETGVGKAYPYGLSGVYSDEDSYVQSQYIVWKNEYVTASGAGGNLRVQRDSGDNWDTVSEGIGYGMLLSVYYNDQTTFNGLYAYYKAHADGNGFMNWQIDANGNTIGQNGATDADEDVTVSLCFASKVWGNSGSINYSSEATTMINKIMAYEVESGTYVLKAGDTWGGSSIYDPSYFAPTWYRIFQAQTGDARWSSVINSGYTILNNIQQYNAGTGFSPDWCTSAGLNCGKIYDLGYDAIRVPFRIGLDWSWNGNTQAQGVNNKFLHFFDVQGSTNNLRDGYTIAGTVTGSWWTPTFAAMIAASSMSTNDISIARKWYDITKNKQDPFSNAYHYFGSCLRMLSITYMTGNFQNLYTGGQPVSSISSVASVSSATSSSSSKVSSAASSNPATSSTASSVSSSGVTPSGNSLTIQTYQNGAAVQNQVNERIQLANTGTSPITLSAVKIRYFIKYQGNQSYGFACDYSTLGTANVTGLFTALNPAPANADAYNEISFTSAAGSLAAGATVEVQCRFWKSDWSNIDNSLNYSYNPSTSYVNWNKVSAYVNGSLVWGVEPNGSIASSSSAPVISSSSSAPKSSSSSSAPVVSSSSSAPKSSSSSSAPVVSSSSAPASSSSSTGTSSSSGVVYTTITAPFTFDGAGTYHWKIATIPSYINDWNLSALTINGASFLNLYESPSQLPAEQGGFYYIDYTGPYSYSHFEIK